MADEKISAMPDATALDGSEIVPVVQSGSNVKATTQGIAGVSGLTNLQTSSPPVLATLVDDAGVWNQASALLVASGNGFFGEVISPSDGTSGQAFLEIDCFAGTNWPFLQLYFAGGVAGAPTQTPSNSQMGIQFLGEKDDNNDVLSAQIIVITIDDFTTGATGSTLSFQTTKTGEEGAGERLGIDQNGNVTVSGDIIIKGIPLGAIQHVADLPSAILTPFARTFVDDATAPVFGATLTGSGGVTCPVYSDGTNWRAG